MSILHWWLKMLVRWSSKIYRMKERLVRANLVSAFGLVFAIVFSEIALILFALPSYIFLTPGKMHGSAKDIAEFRLRRKVTLGALAGFLFIWALKAGITAGVSWWATRPGVAYAFSASWDFNDPMEYLYNPSVLQIVDGAAVLLPADVGGGSVPEAVIENHVDNAPLSDVPSTESTVEVYEEVEVTPSVPESTPPVPDASGADDASVQAEGFRVETFLPSIVRSVHAAKPTTCVAVVQPLEPQIFPDIDGRYTGFIEVANKPGGEIRYRFSEDGGATWLAYRGGQWLASNDHDWMTAVEVDATIAALPYVQSLLFQAELTSDCVLPVQLMSVTITYEAIVPPPTLFALKSTGNAVTFTDTLGIEITETASVADVRVDTQPIARIVAEADVTIARGVFTVTDTETSLDLSSPIPGLARVWLTFPKDLATDGIRICPGALTETVLSDTCFGGVTLSSSSPVGGGFALSDYEHTDRWYIEISTALAGARIGIPPVVPPPPPASETFSVVGWIDRDVVTSDIELVNSTDRFVLSYGSISDTLTFTLGSALGSSVQLIADLPDDYAAHFVAGVVSEHTAKLYVDGAVIMTRPINDLLLPDETAVTVASGWQLARDEWSSDLPQTIGVLSRALSQVEINTIMLLDTNHPPVVTITSVVPELDGNVVLTYAVQDEEHHYLSVAGAYSMSGAFLGEELPLSEALTDVRHDGSSGLLSSADAVEHVFVWDASSALASYEGEVTIRLIVSDGILSGVPAQSEPTLTDYRAPEVLSFVATQHVDTGVVEITAQLRDAHLSGSLVTLQVSEDDSVWQNAGGVSPLVVEGDVETRVGFTWDASVDFPASEQDVFIRLDVQDSIGNSGTSSSNVLFINTLEPSDVETESVSSGGGRSRSDRLERNRGEEVPEVEAPQAIAPLPSSAPSAPVEGPGVGEPEPIVVVVPGSIAPSSSVPFETIEVIQQARTSELLPAPEVSTVKQSPVSGWLRISGTAVPRATVAVFIHSEQAVMYTARADYEGAWFVDHHQNVLTLAPGAHTVYGIVYDEGSQVKSAPGALLEFDVTEHVLVRLTRFVNVPTMLTTFVAAVIAGFTVYYTHHRAKRI